MSDDGSLKEPQEELAQFAAFADTDKEHSSCPQMQLVSL
jgi:hypothetical protein